MGNSYPRCKTNYSLFIINYSLSIFSVIHSSDCFDRLTAGARTRDTGALANVGTNGEVWSSSSYAAGSHNAGSVWFDASHVYPLSNPNRANGRSVRCVQN